VVISSDSDDGDSDDEFVHVVDISDDPFDDGMDQVYVDELTRVESEIERGKSEFFSFL
jgi:hypothetical protein